VIVTHDIDLPIAAKDIFRLLALKSVADDKGALLEKLNDQSVFKSFVNGVGMTERLKRLKPFSYSHDEGIKKRKDWKTLSDMTEREMCGSKLGFFGKKLKHIGQVHDYEVPLDECRGAARGKIDLLSYTEDTVYLIEVKKCDSDELPVRAFFEVFTFWKTLCGENECFDVFLRLYKKEFLGKKVVPALLLCQESPILTSLLDGKKQSSAGRLYHKFLERGVRVFAYSNCACSESVTADVEDLTSKLQSKY